MTDRGVVVSCRLRGLSAPERESGQSEALQVDPHDFTRLTAPESSHAFHFDRVFPARASQEELFDAIGRPCVRDLVLGYNCTILAYGQTGSGKTHSTIGGVDGDSIGLVPRMLEELFQGFEGNNVALSASFVEVYQERLRDLLRGGRRASRSSSMRIREGAEGVWIDGATEVSLSDLAMARAVIKRGLAQRAVGATRMNQDSSRSHAVFVLTLTKRMAATRVRARLCVVDLAGSEQAKKTQSSGVRLEEAKHINRSLAALGNVIHALTSGSASTDGKPAYVPYRDSKLTRLLQSSLGGNAKTHLLLTCAVASCYVGESLSTLRFGARAKQIENRPTVNATSTSTNEATAVMKTLQRKIESLCEYIRELEQAAASPSCPKCARDASGERASTAIDASSEATDEPLGDQTVVSSDFVMQAEVVALRQAIADMERIHKYQRDHARALTDEMERIEDAEVRRLQDTQAQEIERLDAQLNVADAPVAALEQELRDAQQREADCTVKIRNLESQMREGEKARAAETEILRRQLEKSEQQLSSLYLELASNRSEVNELRSEVMRQETKARALSVEMNQMKQLQAQRHDLSPQKEEPPHRSLKPRPVTVAVGSSISSRSAPGSSLAIQSWWAGDPNTNNDDGDEDRQTQLKSRAAALEALGSPTCRKSLKLHRMRLDSADPDVNGPRTSPSLGGSDRVLTSSGARPFRARLVGLLNSLEEETSSYKELLNSGPIDGSLSVTSARGSSRPVAARESQRRHRLPGLSMPTGTTDGERTREDE